MQSLLDRISAFFGVFTELTPLPDRAVKTGAIVLGLLLLRYLGLLIVRRRIPDSAVRYRWNKTITYTTGFAGALLIGWIWLEGSGTIATVLGLLGAALVITLKDPIVNFAGWLFILSRRPFSVGDRVQISGHRGDVVDVRLFQFTLLEIGNWVAADQSTGRLIHIPNSRVFTGPQINYTGGFPFIWNEIAVAVTFESDWAGAKRMLREIVDRQAGPIVADAEREMRAADRRFLIIYPTVTPTVYTTVIDFGVLLTIRYMCRARQRRDSTQTIWEEILHAFHERDDIDFAYPTRRIFQNPREGKPGTRGPGVEAGTDVEGGPPLL